MYLDFLSVPPFDPRRNRPGVHHSSSPLPNVRAIFLDTRTFRDLHYVPSVGGIKGLPLNAVIASATRLLVRLMGMGKEYGGGVLGEVRQTEERSDEIARPSLVTKNPHARTSVIHSPLRNHHNNSHPLS